MDNDRGRYAGRVEDCALVMSSIYGQDGHDLSVQPAAFNWDADFNWKTLRVGYIKSAFDVPTAPNADASEAQKKNFARRIYDAKYASTALDELRNMGVKLIPVGDCGFSVSAIVPVLEAEGAAAFDDLTRSGRDKLLTGQLPFDWPNQFRIARFYSAVDYVQAMRARTLGDCCYGKLFADVDVIVTPSQGNQLQATNLTGHPAVIVPNGIRGDGAPMGDTEEDGALANTGGPGTPVSLTFLGALYSDARLAAFAKGLSRYYEFPTATSEVGLSYGDGCADRSSWVSEGVRRGGGVLWTTFRLQFGGARRSDWWESRVRERAR